jgi:histidyl-tRNA synthetase
VGFGMGDVVLSELLKDRELVPETPSRVAVVVIPVGGELADAARTVTTRLRANGISAEAPYSPAGVGKDLKAANQARVRFAVIVGPDEWSNKQVNLKDLRTGQQRQLPLDDLVVAIRELAD